MLHYTFFRFSPLFLFRRIYSKFYLFVLRILNFLIFLFTLIYYHCVLLVMLAKNFNWFWVISNIWWIENKYSQVGLLQEFVWKLQNIVKRFSIHSILNFHFNISEIYHLIAICLSSMTLQNIHLILLFQWLNPIFHGHFIDNQYIKAIRNPFNNLIKDL
jgi:hypothetical protein